MRLAVVALLLLGSANAARAYWVASGTPDSMSDKPVTMASVESLNTVNFDPPYAGDQRARLFLRSHPRRGRDVILTIEKGQFICPGYEGCSVLVRFGKKAAERFRCAPSASYEPTTVFVREYDRFLAGLRKAEAMSIEANIYHQGAVVFEFDVRGLPETYGATKPKKPQRKVDPRRLPDSACQVPPCWK